MSSLEIYGVQEDGLVVEVAELRNSSLGMSLVWSDLYERYFGPRDFQSEVKEAAFYEALGGPRDIIEFGWRKAWALRFDPRITDAEYCALVTSFDHCIIPRLHMPVAADQYDAFHMAFPHAEFIGHQSKIAAIMRTMWSDGFDGVCFNATSVDPDPWQVATKWDRRTRESKEWRRYDVNRDKDHWYFDPAARANVIAAGRRQWLRGVFACDIDRKRARR